MVKSIRERYWLYSFVTTINKICSIIGFNDFTLSVNVEKVNSKV